MKRSNLTATGLLALLLMGAVFPIVGSAQDEGRPRRSSRSYDRAYQIAYDEGYRTGFEKGRDDLRDGDRRKATDFPEYRRGDVGYNDRVGDRDEYRAGYRAGLEQGYTDGVSGLQYGARPGDSRVDVGGSAGARTSDGRPVLGRGDQDSYDPDPPDAGQADPNAYPPQAGDPNGGYGSPGGRRASYDTVMVIELETPITTRHSQEGDRFSAVVVEPASYGGARVEGHIGKLVRPGRVSGKGEIVLVFQTITFPDGYSEPLQAQVEEVIGYQRGQNQRPGGRGVLDRAPWEWGRKGGDRNEDIDATAGDEGEIAGESSRGRDAGTIGAGAAAGAILGGILGGGSGAAIGAVIGGAAGGGIVATTKGSEIDLEPGAQLRIRTGQPVRP